MTITPEFAAEKPSLMPSGIQDVRRVTDEGIDGGIAALVERNTSQMRTAGPWKSKSGGDLWVLQKLAYGELHGLTRQMRDLVDQHGFFDNYDLGELRHMPEEFDIRGFRIYIVKGFKAGKVSGGEFHRIRKEIVFVTEGNVEACFEDVYGSEKRAKMSKGTGYYCPPFTIHAFQCITDGSFVVFANTLFDPDDKRTHDTYSAEIFRQLQAKYGH